MTKDRFNVNLQISEFFFLKEIKLKKSLFIFIILCCFSTASYASFYIDAMGVYVDTGDTKTQTGAGLGLGFGITNEVNFTIRSLYSETTEHEDAIDETGYAYISAFGGIEYTPSIPILSRYRMNWTTSLLAGYSNSEAEFEIDGTDESADGYGIALWTGIKYDATQNISPFFEIGYHKSFYSGDFSGASIHGLQFALGVRFFLTNQRKFSDNY